MTWIFKNTYLTQKALSSLRVYSPLTATFGPQVHKIRLIIILGSWKLPSFVHSRLIHLSTTSQAIISKLVYRFTLIPNITIYYKAIVMKATFKIISGQGHNFLTGQKNRTKNLKQTCATFSVCQSLWQITREKKDNWTNWAGKNVAH